MRQFTAIGRLFYGTGIIAFGIQQLVIGDFRPEILPPFPSWAHTYLVFPWLTGLALIFAGIISTGRVKNCNAKKICLYLGFYFLMLILLCQIPYCLIISPNSAYHLGAWAQTLKETAYCGGAFVMARSFYENDFTANNHGFTLFLKRHEPLGSIFFSITMILYGYCHFLYTDYISPMVPTWFGFPVFWTHFAGVALMGAGIAIILKIFTRVIALLLAAMLFIWVIVIHIPDAIAHPYLLHGNEIVSAFDALLFCGTAIVIASTSAANFVKA